MKLNTLSSQTNEEITKELKEQKILNCKEDKNYYCVFCNEMLCYLIKKNMTGIVQLLIIKSINRN
jgi:hypothetical protein